MVDRRKIAILLAFLWVLQGAWCAPAWSTDSVDHLYEVARESYDALKASAEKSASRRQNLKVIKRFEAVVKAYPTSQKASDSRYTIGRIYQEVYKQHGKASDRDAALKAYHEVWEKDAQGNLADDALYQAATLYWIDLKDAQKSRSLLESLLRDYPDGDQVGRARVLLGSLPGASSVRLFGVRPQSLRLDKAKKGVLSVTLPLQRSVKIGQQVMQSPEHRLILDLQGAELLGEGVKPIDPHHGALKRIRMGQYSQDTVRLVFDLADAKDFHVIRLENPDRLRVDLLAQKAPAGAARPKISATPVASTSKNRNPIRLVAIDPGHGGDDPGALGPSGAREKDLVLQIGRRVVRKLEKEGSMHAFLTRDSDVFIPLEKRSQIANEKKADLFVSIHCNANHKRKMRGIQTYFLDTIKDEYSRKLAARENAVSLEKLSDLEMILLDLSNRESHERSSKLAGLLQHQLLSDVSSRYRDVHDLGVHTAVFLVLFYAEMPAVLVETSFVSNKEEESRLRSEGYQEALADAIAAGVRKYFAQEDRIVGTL